MSSGNRYIQKASVADYLNILMYRTDSFCRACPLFLGERCDICSATKQATLTANRYQVQLPRLLSSVAWFPGEDRLRDAERLL